MMKLPRMKPIDESVCAQLARHEHLTLMLDLDGTLIPFAPTPEGATLDHAAIALLDSLRRANVRIVIVSGRPRDALSPLRELVPELCWIAEHGSWWCDESGAWRGPSVVPEIEELAQLFAPFAAVPGVRLELKSLSICLHWRLVPRALKDDLIAAATLTCDEWLESRPELERLSGVEMLEVRRRSSNKSRAVAWLRERVPHAKIIAIGDDETDEDMFGALRADELAIGVGDRATGARCRLPHPVAVRGFLSWLHDVRTEQTTQPFRSLECRTKPARPTNSRLLVVSNRIPPISRGRQTPVGGLVSALQPALEAHDGVWLGWNGEERDGECRLDIADDVVPVRAAFPFATTWRERFYGGFCNRALWPLFHGFAGRVRYTDEDWLAYVAANAEFARHAQELAAPDGTIWIHDYHLLLAGHALRQRGFTGPLGLFLHIPFPQHDLFDTLPWGAEILEAMLAFDLIGFHTQQWRDNFHACAMSRARTRRLPELAVLPIGIDADLFKPDESVVDRDVAGLRATLGTRRMILGVDRLDYAKGIPERLIAFERLLDTTPNWRGQVSFVQISVPSREDVPEYAELRQHVEKLVGRINGRFGEADWVPVRYLYRSYDHRVLSQLYRLADVALVTPLRDGLNLVAKEFVAAQDPNHPGVLVLSRFAGAAAELVDAVLTNPFHPDGLAGDIDRALRMDGEERKQRHARLLATIAGRTPARWAAAFLDRLATARSVTRQARSARNM